MIAPHVDSKSPSSTGRRHVATSLFGAAMLASVATASGAQVTYLDSITALAGTIVSSGFVVAAGYNQPGDGGGGMLLPTGSTICTPDNGIVFTDGAIPHNCFVRADPTFSVREWGALCDEAVVNPPGGALTASWDPGFATGNGTLSVPTQLVSSPPQAGQFIAISQVGSPTLFGTSLPAVSLTRFSTLSNTGSLYSAGNLVSFAGGSFSQQAATRLATHRRTA
jgi:hypothetical protein